MPHPPHGPAHITRRRFLGSAATAAAGAAFGLGTPAWARTAVKGTGPGAACDLPPEVLRRIVRGWRRDRGGQLIVVPHGMDFMSGGISHSTPFAYTQDVPMLWYGPGFIRAHGAIPRPVTLADVAPTIAQLIGFDWTAPDGQPMTEALVPGAPKPKLVVVLVWDAGGRFVLDIWPNAWPNLRGLIPQGTWFDAATVGSSPSNTAPAHATIGTGAFPFRHGVLDNYNRYPDGSVRDPYAQGPDNALLVRALAEDYAAAAGHDALVGLAASIPWHLGMIGRGNDGGGPASLAVLKTSGVERDQGPPAWGLPAALAPLYRCPDYVSNTGVVPPIETFWHVAETLGGGHVGSGTWRGHPIAKLGGGFDTPARVPFQQALWQALIEREGFGTHDATDLLFLNGKLIDEVGHMFSASGIEMKDAIQVQDRWLAKMIAFLERHLPGEYVLLVTADHGHTAAPTYDDGFAIDEPAMRRLIAKRFGTGSLLQIPRPTWLNLDATELRANGVTIEQIAKFVAGLTKGQTHKANVTVPRARAGERVFEAVFAGSLLGHLPCTT